jgi:hypothetical protein
MADEDSNTESCNPLVGVFPEDTLAACCSILSYLQKVEPKDALSEQETWGLANIHHAIEHALSSETGRITAYRLAAKSEAVRHE